MKNVALNDKSRQKKDRSKLVTFFSESSKGTVETTTESSAVTRNETSEILTETIDESSFTEHFDMPPSGPSSLMSVDEDDVSTEPIEKLSPARPSSDMSVETAGATITTTIGLNDAKDLFQKPKESARRAFFESHPIQDDNSVAKIKCTKEGLPRKWLTHKKEDDSLFCTICIVFGKISSNFVHPGEKDRRHWGTRIQEHEKSRSHLEAVSDYIEWMHHHVIEDCFTHSLRISQAQIQRKRDFLSRVIDIVKLIGKLGIAFRGTHEAIHTLENPLLNHGILLELVMLLTKFDKVTDDHVKSCIKKSVIAYEKWKKEGKKGRMGRGKKFSKHDYIFDLNSKKEKSNLKE